MGWLMVVTNQLFTALQGGDERADGGGNRRKGH